MILRQVSLGLTRLGHVGPQMKKKLTRGQFGFFLYVFY